MNVTSLWSKGYLEPAVRQAYRIPDGSSRTNSASWAVQERQILAQESALKARSGSGAQVSTSYTYSVGPDGRRYITGATVKIKGEKEALDGIGGGVAYEELESSPQQLSDPLPTKDEEPDSSEAETVKQLEQAEREVVAHEAAHKAAGGRFAGAVSYTYTRGPDGKSYITGGSVPISIPSGGDPEQTLRDLAQVQRAALAPGNPSGQDLSVAAQAAAMAAQARQEHAAQKSEPESGSDALKTGVASVRAGLKFESIQDGAERSEEDSSEPPPASEASLAYASNSSDRGLWTVTRGFELPGSQDEVRKKDPPGLSLAA